MKKQFFYFILMTALFAAVLSSCMDYDTLVFSVTFDSKGGTQIPTQIVRQGNKVEKPADPTRSEYYFAGWSMSENATRSFWNFEQRIVTADIRLYANWSKNRYTVTVSSDGDGTASADVALGVVSAQITLEATASSGYRFAEWQVIEGNIALSGVTDNPATFIMPDETVEVIALFIPYQVTPIKMWQTYIGFPDGNHEWDEIEAEYTVTRLPDLPMRGGWGFTDGRDLIFADQPNGWRLFKYTNNYTAWEYTHAQIPRFQSMTHEFFVDRGYVYAKPFSNSNPLDYNNKRIQLSGLDILAYAQYKNDVIACTNWGEVLIFRNNEWYRLIRVQSTEIWVLTPGADMLTQASGKQFYCSIIYQGRTLIGEYPTGKIYEFTGSVLQVSDLSPPAELLVVTPGFEGEGKEAQSMAIYGGDLFVGYWPDGVILRYDHKQKQWSRFIRLFDFPAKGNFRDYYDPDHVFGNQVNFYGQRIQSLVPFEDGLYAVTSNKNNWNNNLVPSPLLSEEQIRQYGAVYKIYRPGCRTTYFPR